MGKPQKAKSRAARRQATPPMEIGPIVRHTTPPPKEKVALLGVRDNSGVKKKSKKKQLTAKQKARQQAAMEKAEAAMGKLEKKREESRGKSKIIQTRAGDWENLNEKIEEELEKALEAAVAKDEVDVDVAL